MVAEEAFDDEVPLRSQPYPAEEQQSLRAFTGFLKRSPHSLDCVFGGLRSPKITHDLIEAAQTSDRELVLIHIISYERDHDQSRLHRHQRPPKVKQNAKLSQ